MFTENIERIKSGLDPIIQYSGECLIDMEIEREQIPRKVLLLMRRFVKKGARLQRSLGNTQFFQENHILLKIEELAEVADLLRLEANDSLDIPGKWRNEIEEIHTMLYDFLLKLESRWAS